uniref:Abnormal cell migration protein 18-like fibronectin type I domain-containing protein n=1 Tax=Angiostrongylus cantonensis TaxID=6313 RepID=A0A0K0DNC8_ANGCA
MTWLYIAQFLSVALACIENGKKYSHGDEWINMNTFKVRCEFMAKDDWRVIVIGCIAPNGTMVPLGSERLIGDQIWVCKKDENGYIYFGPKTKTTNECDGHPYGSVWKEKWLQYRCGDRGVKEFLGCITESKIFVANGDVKLVDGFYIQCKKHENGSVVMQGVATPGNTKCKDNEGRERLEGSEWTEGTLQHRCGRGGIKEPIGCITTTGILIPVEETKSVGGFYVECKKHDDGTVIMQRLGRPTTTKCRDIEGRERDEGSEWTEGTLQHRCGRGGIKEPIGCITTSGILIPIGETKSVDGSYVECKKHDDGTVILQNLGTPSNGMCKDSEGRKREEGSHWKEGSLQFRCGKGGVKDLMGCITASGTLLPYGEVNLVNGKRVKCEKLADGTITMSAVSRFKCHAKCRDNEGRGVTEGRPPMRWSEFFTKSLEGRYDARRVPRASRTHWTTLPRSK